MALRTYNSDAWGDIEDLKTPEVDNARQSAECAKIYQNDAWEEVWSAIKIMIEKSNDIKYGFLEISDDNLTFEFNKYMDVYDGSAHGTQTGGGTIVFYVDGEWTNPEISFDWEGEFGRFNSTGTTWYTASAGGVSLYSRTTSGTETTTEVVDVKPTGSNTGDADDGGYPDGIGSYSGQLTGTFNRLGLSIDIASYSGNFYRSMMRVLVTNVKIGTTKIGFPQSCEFDNQEF